MVWFGWLVSLFVLFVCLEGRLDEIRRKVAIVAASQEDRQKLTDKAAEHADINQYQFSCKKSKCIVFGNDATPEIKDLEILLPANDKSEDPVRMKHTDRYTYLGLDLHEMLGVHDYWLR